MNKVIEYIIGAKDATANAIKSALNRIKTFASSVGTNLQNIRAGFAMLGTAAHNAVAFLQRAFAFERMTAQFKTLIGNMDEARAHMRMLQELGDTPPFNMEQFAAASRALMVMTDGALGFRKSLELIGDAAAATGQPIESLAHEVGRAYAIIRDGQPLTRATMALRSMGVLTPEVAARLDELQKSGASTTEIWGELETALKRYKGAMEETEQTADGLMGAIKSQWDDTLREFGAACLETSKDALGGLLEWMRKLREDGSIAVWADKTGQAFSTVIDAAKEAIDVFSTLGDFLWNKLGLSDIYHGLNSIVQGAASATGTLIGGGSLSDASKAWNQASVEELGKGYYARMAMESGFLEGEDVERYLQAEREADEERIRHEEEVRRNAIQRQADEKADKARREAEEEEKKLAGLAAGQAKIDERRAREKAQKDAEAARKAAEEEEKERLRIEKEIAAERRRLWKRDLAEKQREERLASKEAEDAQRRLADAVAQEQRAWGWYRNRDSWKSQLEEERAEAQAQKQFDKDFEKLKDRHRDWRTAKLSDEEEVVRRVGLAREEKSKAEEYARETAEAAARAADAIEQIQSTLDGGD